MQPLTTICSRNNLRKGFKDIVWQIALLTTDIKCSLSWPQFGSVSLLYDRNRFSLLLKSLQNTAMLIDTCWKE